MAAYAKPPLMKYVESGSMSLEQSLVPPATYDYLREGWWDGARIVAVPPSEPSNENQETSPLITDASEPQCNPFSTLCERLCMGLATVGSIGGYFNMPDDSDTPTPSPTRFIRRTGMRTFALSETSDDPSESDDAKIMDFEIEGWLGTTSTFTMADDPERRALLWKANGLNPWWSTTSCSQRTLDDFDNTRYSCNTAFCSENITQLTRLSDNIVVAHFTRNRLKFSWGLMGTLQVSEPLSEDVLDLIFCAIYAKFLLDEERRRSSHR